MATIGPLLLAGCVLAGCSQVADLITPPDPSSAAPDNLLPATSSAAASSVVPASAATGVPSASVTVAAPKSLPTSPTPSTPSVSIPPVSISRPAAPTSPPSAPGYTYAAAPAAVTAAFVAQQVREALSAPLVRSVLRNKTMIGSVGVRCLDPASVGDLELERSLVDGVVKGLAVGGYTVRRRTVSGHSVVVATRKGSTIAAWYRDGLLLEFVSSHDEDTAVGFATATLA